MPRLTRIRHAEMLSDYGAGDLTVSEIATKYGIHQSAVSHAAQRAGLPMRQAGQPLNPKRATRRKWQNKILKKGKPTKRSNEPLRKESLCRSRANGAEKKDRRPTTMITANRWKSCGSASCITSNDIES